MTDNAPELRASDADRERVAEILRDALAEGRLDMEEFEERLETTYKARTYGELAPITRDLPAPGGAPQAPVNLFKEPPSDGSWTGRVIGGGDTSPSWAVAVMGGFQRKGRWTVPRRMNCVAFWGGGEIDLREADFSAGEVEINCVAIMGGIQILVPPGVEIVSKGIGIMGDFSHRESGVPAGPGAPRVVITGFAFWGGVDVERKRTKAALRQEKLDRREERRRLKEDRRGERHRMLEGHHDVMRDLLGEPHKRREDHPRE
ncbi:DUF1707 domain-containing protein [Streptomyces niveiscabiei]|uniref:DUF1707 SHOCT-like domain-containing protein n=1 Tax=Streptomyces niveiscabiei TaxID=164115 RepID=UPI0029B7E100|nr:DUF1707 domain-containing protein [Streptomyces niveiscabiei]MDX3383617.1 DUF1707 domain-containing protein [Streptomyces niveiscabiei]